jgi:membrane protein DedA with SNARE-associated domain
MPLAKFLTQTFLGATIWGGGLMVLGYVLGSQWEEVAAKAKRIDLVIAALIVLAILAIGIRFVVVRRRERAANAPAD